MSDNFLNYVYKFKLIIAYMERLIPTDKKLKYVSYHQI